VLKQKTEIDAVVQLCQIPFTRSTKFIHHSKVMYDDWADNVIPECRCDWVNYDDDVYSHYHTYIMMYHDAIRQTPLSATFNWDSAVIDLPNPKLCFMAERELNLTPYSILHPVLLKALLPDRTFRMISRIKGAPRDMDPNVTFGDWCKSRGDSTADNGLSARIRCRADITAQSLKALQTYQESNSIILAQDEATDQCEDDDHDDDDEFQPLPGTKYYPEPFFEKD
jgi:hypothetical protein